MSDFRGYEFLDGYPIGRGIAACVRILHRHVRSEHVIDERLRRELVRCVLANRHVVKPAGPALLGQQPLNGGVLPGRPDDWPVPHVSYNDVLDYHGLCHVLARIESFHVGLYFHQQLTGLHQFTFTVAIDRVPQIFQGGRHDLFPFVRESQLPGVAFRTALKKERPTAHVGIILGVLGVVTQSGHPPKIGDRIFVARVERGVEESGREVFQIRDVFKVQRSQEPLSDMNRHEVVGRKHHVVRRASGLKLGQQVFVSRERVIGDFYAELLFESGNSVRMDVFFPVVDEQFPALFLDLFQDLGRRVLRRKGFSVQGEDIRQQCRGDAPGRRSADESLSGYPLLE